MDTSQVTQSGSLLDPSRGLAADVSEKLPRLIRLAIIAALAILSWLLVVAAPYIF